jgi:plasmid maintenance system killer protein
MIVNIRHKGLRRFFEDNDSKGLQPEHRGWWAVTLRADWRIIFRFKGSNVVDVDLVDYG